jgi:hypothetical protein
LHKRPVDYIDVDYIEDTNDEDSSDFNNVQNSDPDRNEGGRKGFRSSLMNVVKRAGRKVKRGVKKGVSLISSRDAEKPARRSGRMGSSRRRNDVDDQLAGIEQLFGESSRGLMPGGLVGGLMGGLMKGAFSAVGNMMAESANDIMVVQEAVRRNLFNDPTASQYLGSNIQVGAAQSTSSSTSSFNGQVSKQVQLVLPVSGSSGAGVVMVIAVGDGSNPLALRKLDLEVGRTRQSIPITDSTGGDIVDV